MIRWILLLSILIQCAKATPSVTCDLSYISYDDDYNDFRIPYTTTCGNRIRPVITITFSGPLTSPFDTTTWGPDSMPDYPFRRELFLLLVNKMLIVNTDTNQLFFPTFTYDQQFDSSMYRIVERSFIGTFFTNGQPLTIELGADFFFSGTWNISYVATPFAIQNNPTRYTYISNELLPSFSCVVKANKTILTAVSDPVIGQLSTAITQYNILMFSNPVKKCVGAEPFNGTDIGYPFSDRFIAVDPDSQGYATSWYTTTNSARVVAGMCGISPMNACDRTGTQAVMGFPYKTTMYSQPAIVSSGNCVTGTYNDIIIGWKYFEFGNSFISLDDPTNLHAIRRLPFVLNRTLVNDSYRTNMAISPFTGVGAIPSVTHAVTGISDSTTCWNYSTLALNNNNGVAYNSSLIHDDDLPHIFSYYNYFSYIVSAKKFIYFDGTTYYTRILIASPMKNGDSPPIQVFAIRNGGFNVLQYALDPIAPPSLWSGQFDANSLFVNDQQVYAYLNFYDFYLTFASILSIPTPVTLYNTSLVSIFNVSIVSYSEIRFFCTWCDVDPILSYSVNASAFSLQCEQTATLSYIGNFGTYLGFTIGNLGCQNRSLLIASVGKNAYHTSYRIPQLQPVIVAKQIYTTYIVAASFKGGRVLAALCFNCQNDPVTTTNTTFWSLTCNGTSVTSITFRSLVLSNMEFDVVGCTQLQNIFLTVQDGAYHTALAASLPQYNISVNLTYDFGMINAYLLDNTYLILQFNNTNVLDSTHFNLSRITLQCYNLTATLGLPQNSYGYDNQTRITILGNCNNVTAPILTLQSQAVVDSIALTSNGQAGPMIIPSIELPPILSASCIPGTNISNITLLLKSSGFNLSRCAACNGYPSISGCNWAGATNISFAFTSQGDGCVNISLISTQLANTFETQTYLFHTCMFIDLVSTIYTPAPSNILYLTYDTHPGYSIINSSVIPSYFNFTCDGTVVSAAYGGLGDSNTSIIFYLPYQCYNSLIINSAAFAFKTTENLYSNIIYQKSAVIDYANVSVIECIPGNEVSTVHLNVPIPSGTTLGGVSTLCPQYNHSADGTLFYLIGKIPTTCFIRYQFVNYRNVSYNESVPVQLCPIDKSLRQANYTCFPNSTTTSFIHTYLVGKWSYISILQSVGNCSNPVLLRYSPPLIETSISGAEDDIQFCFITYAVIDAADQLVQFSTNYTICPVLVRDITVTETQLVLILVAVLLISLLIILFVACRVPSEAKKESAKEEEKEEEEIELM